MLEIFYIWDVVARLMVSCKTHSLLYVCKRKVMLMVLRERKWVTLGCELGHSQEWAMTSLFLQSQMLHIATSVSAFVLPQAWPSDLVVLNAKHCLVNLPSLVWSTHRKIEGRCSRLSQRAPSSSCIDHGYFLSVPGQCACLSDFAAAELIENKVDSAGEACLISECH